MNVLDILKQNCRLRVSVNFGGPHYMLNWYTHNEGNHIVLGRSLKAVEQVIPLLIKRHGIHVELKSLDKINIVKPPSDFINAVSQKHLDSEIDSRRCNLAYEIGEYYKHNKKLPPNTSKCDCVTVVDKHDEYGDHNELEYDSSCQKCDQYQFFVDLPLEKIAAYQSNSYSSKEQGFVLSDLNIPEADENQELLYIEKDFGHHSSGLYITPCKEGYRYNYVLFFFQKEEDAACLETLTKHNDFLAQKIKEIKDKKEAEKEERRNGDNSVSKYLKERDDKLFKFLSGESNES